MGIFRDDDDRDDNETWQWKIGDPVDDANGGSMDAQNWGHERGVNQDSDRKNGARSHDSRVEKYSNKAWDLYNEHKLEEALHYIDMALDLDDRHSRNWNRKAIILESMVRYEESEAAYNKSLELSQSNVVYDNKAWMLLKYSGWLVEESKKVSNGEILLEKANQKITEAFRIRPGEKSEIDIEEFLSQWKTVQFYIDYERRFQLNLKTLKGFDRSELFTITAMDLYGGGSGLSYHTPLKLLREPDNEQDSDAIAVYLGDRKIGYVANKEYTKYELTSSASELCERINDSAQAEFLFFLQRYSAVQFYIGRIVNE